MLNFQVRTSPGVVLKTSIQPDEAMGKNWEPSRFVQESCLLRWSVPQGAAWTGLRQDEQPAEPRVGTAIRRVSLWNSDE